MNAPEVEQHLTMLATRRLPESWKRGILLASEAARPRALFVPRFVERAAWSAIAAAWLAIAALRTTTPFIAPPSGPPMSTRDVAAHWNQIRLYAVAEFVPVDESATPAHIHIEQELIIHIRPRS